MGSMMVKKLGRDEMKYLLSIVLVILLAACSITPTIQTGPNAQISYDGLAKVNNTRVNSAWVRPGIDLSAYDKLILVGAGIKYRSVRDASRVYLSNFEGFPLDDEQRNYIETAVREIFTEGIAMSDRFEIVDVPGPDTLTLTGSLIDVVSNTPPLDDTVDTVYFRISQLGEATLILELSDSLSGQSLARATDKRIFEPSVREIDPNIITTRFEFERELRVWVALIRNGLETLADMPLLPAD